jgi:hypothetical protein
LHRHKIRCYCLNVRATELAVIELDFLDNGLHFISCWHANDVVKSLMVYRSSLPGLVNVHFDADTSSCL